MRFGLIQRYRKPVVGSLVGAAVGLVSGLVAFVRPALLEPGELSTYDARVRQAAQDEKPSPDILIVDVSEEDLRAVDENLGLSWPWPRELFGVLVQVASEGGAQVVALDWIFQDRGLYAASDLESFATAMRASGKALFGLAMPRPMPGDGDRESRGRWAARLARFDERDAAVRAAFALHAWNLRTFVLAEPGGSALWAGGKEKAEDVTLALGRVADAGALEELVGESVPAFEPRELADAELASEVTVQRLLAERDALALEAPPGMELDERAVVPPVSVLAAAAARLGNVMQANDQDGIFRHHQPLVRHGGRLVPSLPFAAWLAVHPEVQPRFEGHELVLGERRVRLDAHGRMPLRFHSGRYPHVSAYALLRAQAQKEAGETPELDPALFKDKVVFVSASALSLRDVRPTPVDRSHLGAEINALAFDNLATGRSVRRASPLADALHAVALALMVALAVVAVWAGIKSAWLALAGAAAVVVAGISGSAAFSTWLLDAHGVWLGLAVPAGGALAATLLSMLALTGLERHDRRFVQDALGRYTSPVLVRQLMANPEYLSLEWGEVREISVYFSDIAGFTNFSEQLKPERLVALLNDYLTNMTDIVLAHGGVVDKYIGDALMAFWGAPLPEPEHARQAVLAALAMRRRCELLRPKWKAEFGPDVIARAGINSGTAVSGNMGSRHKFNYTVMGDMVNLASRLEGANKPYGTTLMISEDCYLKTGGAVDVRELDFLAVKGKLKPVRVYEVLAPKGQTEPQVAEAVRLFETGLARYREQQFQEAMKLFEQALAVRPDDGPSATFHERCRLFADAPPGAGWDGVWRMKEK